MTRRWVGPTPWTHVLAHYAKDKRVIPYSQVETQGQDKGYREAMNSELVERLVDFACDVLIMHQMGKEHCRLCNEAQTLKDAYEAGLEPVQYKHTVHQDCEANPSEAG